MTRARDPPGRRALPRRRHRRSRSSAATAPPGAWCTAD